MSNDERGFIWTPAGKKSRLKAGVELAEAIEAFHSPMRTERPMRPGTLVLIEGLADSGRVIRLACQPMTRPGMYTIVAVGTVRGDGLDTWRSLL